MQGTNTDYITSSGKSFLLFCSQWYFYSHFLSVCDFSKAVQNYFPFHFIIKWFLHILGSFNGQRRAPACSCRPTVIGNHLSNNCNILKVWVNHNTDFPPRNFLSLLCYLLVSINFFIQWAKNVWQKKANWSGWNQSFNMQTTEIGIDL